MWGIWEAWRGKEVNSLKEIVGLPVKNCRNAGRWKKEKNRNETSRNKDSKEGRGEKSLHLVILEERGELLRGRINGNHSRKNG